MTGQAKKLSARAGINSKDDVSVREYLNRKFRGFLLIFLYTRGSKIAFSLVSILEILTPFWIALYNSEKILSENLKNYSKKSIVCIG